MLHRILAASVFMAGLFLLADSAIAQMNSPDGTLSSLQPDFTNESNPANPVFTMGSIRGIVLSEDHHPLSNAKVEIRNLSSGQSLAMGYTDNSGAFQLSNVPNGNYEVLATSGISEARQQLRVNSEPAELTLQLPFQTQAAGGPAVVSVQQLTVPQNAKNALKKAQEAANKDDFPEAQKQVAKAIAAAPKYSDAIAFRGVLAMQQHDLTSASNDFQEAIDFDNANSMAHVAMGALYNIQGKYDDAVREIDRGMMLNPRAWNAHFEMSRAQLGKGNFDSALKEVNQAKALLDRSFAPIHLIKGQVLMGLRLYAGAVQELEEFLSQDNDAVTTAQVKHAIEEAKALAAAQK